MPGLNVAASPVAVTAAASPNTAANAAQSAGSSPAAGAEPQGGNPFSAVLGRQMREGAASSGSDAGNVPASPALPAEQADPGGASLAALLPMLLGMGDAAATRAADANRADKPGARRGPRDGDDDLLAAQAELALTLLAAPAAPATVGAASAGAGGEAPGIAVAAARVADQVPASAPSLAGSQPATAAAPAIVAATPEGSAAPRADAAPATLAADPSKIRAENEARRDGAATGREAGALEHVKNGLPEQAMVPMHATAAARHAEADMTYRITPAVGSRQWEAAVGNSLVFMTGRQQNSAELVLTPPQFGRIEISLTVNNDNTATATFVSASPAVQEALTNAVPRLKEILADAGITLSQADVNAGSPEQSPGGQDDGGRRAATPDFGSDGQARAAALPSMRAMRGVVDVFA